MAQRRFITWVGVLALIACFLSAGSARAEGEAAAEKPAMDPNTGKVSVSIGLDFTNMYVFRGMVQENQGIIVQPSASVAIDVWEQGDIGISVHADVWGSIHENLAPSSVLYEVDYTLGVTVNLPYGLEADVSYVWLTSPSVGGEFAQEIDVKLAWDDSGFWKDRGIDLALNPYVLVAIETANGSDLGTEQGIYLEIGLSYAREILENTDYPLTLHAGMTVGFSLDQEYFETATADDDGWGFVKLNVGASMPIKLIPAEYGSWNAYVDVAFYFLGEENAIISGVNATGGDEFEVAVTGGISMEY